MDKVKMDFAFFAIAFNIKKMCSTMAKRDIDGGICPKQNLITGIAPILYVKNQKFEGNSQNIASNTLQFDTPSFLVYVLSVNYRTLSFVICVPFAVSVRTTTTSLSTLFSVQV